MKMHNPPHPGEIIKGLWLDPMGVSITKAAKAMGKTLSKIIRHASVTHKQGRVTPEMAIRLSLALGSSVAKVNFGAESWLGHQTAYDLWEAEQRRIEPPVVPLFAGAAAAV